MFHALRSLALFALAALVASTAAAQAWPTRAVTMIVPFGAGGGTDVIARAVSEDLSKALKQPIVVEPRPGANGAIGSAVVARAAPDGYTLLFTAQSTYSLNPNLMKEPPYDQLKDLVPVASIGRSPWMLAVPAASEFKSVADVVAFGKANPGKLVVPLLAVERAGHRRDVQPARRRRRCARCPTRARSRRPPISSAAGCRSCSRTRPARGRRSRPARCACSR